MARVIRSDALTNFDIRSDAEFTPTSWPTPAEEQGGLCVNWDDAEYDFHFEVHLTDDDLSAMGYEKVLPLDDVMDFLADEEAVEVSDETVITITAPGVTITVPGPARVEVSK